MPGAWEALFDVLCTVPRTARCVQVSLMVTGEGDDGKPGLDAAGVEKLWKEWMATIQVAVESTGRLEANVRMGHGTKGGVPSSEPRLKK